MIRAGVDHTCERRQFIGVRGGTVLDSYGAGSYIDAVILRDRDANATGDWTGEADGVLEERRYYCQNWRHDVVAIVTAGGAMAEQVRYSAYGVPFGIPQGDVNGDGTVDNDDRALINAAMDESVGDPGYDVRADINLDGTVTSADNTIWSANDGVTLGWDAISEDPDDGLGNRKSYAGYQHDPALAASWTLYHVRHRVYNADLGRWTRRDPLGYVDGMSLYEYVGSKVTTKIDSQGHRGGFPNDMDPGPGGGGGDDASPNDPSTNPDEPKLPVTVPITLPDGRTIDVELPPDTDPGIMIPITVDSLNECEPKWRRRCRIIGSGLGAGGLMICFVCPPAGTVICIVGLGTGTAPDIYDELRDPTIPDFNWNDDMLDPDYWEPSVPHPMPRRKRQRRIDPFHPTNPRHTPW